MSEQDNIATVRAAYAAWQRGDIPSVLNACTNDVEWVVPGPSDVIPYAGVWRGTEQLKRYFDVLSDTVDFEEYVLEEVIAQGEQVVVVGRSRVVAKSTGYGFADDWAHWFEFRRGQVARMRYYTNTAGVSVVNSLAQVVGGPGAGRRSVPRRSQRPGRSRANAARPRASVVRNVPTRSPAPTAMSAKPANGTPPFSTRTASESPTRSAVGSRSGTISSANPTGTAHEVSAARPALPSPLPSPTRTNVLAYFA
jgi:ketosteroid isomerase-like protein